MGTKIIFQCFLYNHLPAMKIQPYLLKKLSSLRRRRSQGRAAQAVVLVLDRRLNSLNIPFSMTVEARLEIQKEPSEHPGEEDKFNYDLFIDVDPDRKDHMTVSPIFCA